MVVADKGDVSVADWLARMTVGDQHERCALPQSADGDQEIEWVDEGLERGTFASLDRVGGGGAE